MAIGDAGLMIAAFGIVTSLLLMVFMFFTGKSDRVEARMEQASPRDRRQPQRPAAGRVLPAVGSMVMPEDEGRLGKLKAQLLQAGLYRRHSTAIYMGLKVILMLSPMLFGVGLATIGMMTLIHGVIFGAVVGLIGALVPTIWLGHLKSNRQRQIRRALPDALDVIVVCLEGGLSLPGALARVSEELKHAHPLLADEMSIVRREIQLGRSTGEALRQFADRFDAEELRSLSSVVNQAERYGASVVKALRVHADTLRLKRYQNAEAMAQKAPVKLIFPTVLCIFPALYVVLMGPAGVQLFEMLDKIGN